jgi:hypothetical protein
MLLYYKGQPLLHQQYYHILGNINNLNIQHPYQYGNTYYRGLEALAGQ